MPAFPFHGWMPDAYRTMPLPALAVFSGVVSKVAAYGFLRLVLPLFRAAAHDYQMILLILALLSILYGSRRRSRRPTAPDPGLLLGRPARLHHARDLRPRPAADGAQGALLQAVNHGLVVAPLFLIIVVLAARAGGL